MERYIIFIPADGPCRLVACDDGDSIKLETLQELVDGLTPEEIKALQDFKNGKDGRFQTFNPD